MAITRQFACDLATPADQVWSFATQPDGMNYELRPLLRMTVPRGLSGITVDDLSSGQHLGRSWLLLFGLLPFEYDDITIDQLGPGFRFKEDSTMLSIRRWQHDREIIPSPDGGCRVVDKLSLELRYRFPGAEVFAPWFVGVLFRHRHRRLAKRFGAGAIPAASQS